MTPERRGIARPTDPETSHIATSHASTASDAARWAILTLLAGLRPEGLYDDEIIEHLDERMGEPGFTESGIQTRRKELVRLGLVEPIATTLNSRRCKVLVWAATADGSAVAADGHPGVVAAMFREFRRDVDRRRAHPEMDSLRAELEAQRLLLGEFVVGFEDQDIERLSRALQAARSSIR